MLLQLHAFAMLTNAIQNGSQHVRALIHDAGAYLPSHCLLVVRKPGGKKACEVSVIGGPNIGCRLMWRAAPRGHEIPKPLGLGGDEAWPFDEPSSSPTLRAATLRWYSR